MPILKSYFEIKRISIPESRGVLSTPRRLPSDLIPPTFIIITMYYCSLSTIMLFRYLEINYLI